MECGKGLIKMNKVDTYWQAFCEKEGLMDTQYKEAFQFGVMADWLADLVVEGKKTATCSSFPIYKIEGEPLPQVGEYNIVLDGQEEPVAIIKETSVEVMPFNEIPEAFALAEGEGDYEDWYTGHVEFFTSYLAKFNIQFDETMLTVCEQFKKVYPK